jgi:hypothetical protein
MPSIFAKLVIACSDHGRRDVWGRELARNMEAHTIEHKQRSDQEFHDSSDGGGWWSEGQYYGRKGGRRRYELRALHGQTSR